MGIIVTSWWWVPHARVKFYLVQSISIRKGISWDGHSRLGLRKLEFFSHGSAVYSVLLGALGHIVCQLWVLTFTPSLPALHFALSGWPWCTGCRLQISTNLKRSFEQLKMSWTSKARTGFPFPISEQDSLESMLVVCGLDFVVWATLNRQQILSWLLDPCGEVPWVWK